jgi:gluconolactonase
VSDIELLAWGYGLVEGPRVDRDDNLYFSDVHGGGVHRRCPDGAIELVVPKRRGVGGIALHADGGVVISGRDLCHVRDGHSRTVFAPDAPGLNDLFVDAAGRVVCGTMRSNPFDTTAPRTPGEAWLVDIDGTPRELYGDVALANGVGLSPDGSVLYHSDTTRGIWAHDYDDGAVSNRRLFLRAGGLGPDELAPDGLAVDEAGTVWVADVSGSGALRGFAPDGTEVGRVQVPARMVTSVCFGGADRRDLYIVTGDNTDDPNRHGSIYRTRADVPGCPVALARV